MNISINGMHFLVLGLNILLIFYAIFSNLKGRIRCTDKMIVIYISFVSIFLCFMILKNLFAQGIAIDPVRLYTNSTLIISIVHFYIIYSFVKKRERRKGLRK